MAGTAVFTLPFPLEQEQLSALAEQFLTEEVFDEDDKVYFLSSLVYLLRFARDNLTSRQNVTLGIGQPTKDKDSDELWRKDRLWVKVKMTGGSAPRSNFMATSYGIAQVNWKADTHTFLGSIPVNVIIEVSEKFASGTLFTGFTDLKEPSALFSPSQSTERYQQAISVFGDILMMSSEDMSAFVHNRPRLDKVASDLFRIFDEDGSNSIDQKEFIKFFSQFLHQPIEVTIQFFNKASSGTGKINKGEFSAFLWMFFTVWMMEEKSKRLYYFWSVILNMMVEMPPEKRVTFRNDKAKHYELFLNAVQKSGVPPSVHWELYLRLHQNFEDALHRPKTPEDKVREKFNAVAVHGIITIEQYMNHFDEGMDEILSFLTDWDECRRIYDSARLLTREDAIAWLSSLDGPIAMETQIFAVLGAAERLDFSQFLRFNRCYGLPSYMNIPEEDWVKATLSLQDATSDLINKMEKDAIEEAEYPGKDLFTELARRKPSELIALTMEEFRLRAIAHDLFVSVYPVRDKHDFETFRLYANCMCEVFQVENAQETITKIFDHFNTGGFITESDFVLCLKQMIGHQLKWAKSREFQENIQKEGIRQMMKSPEAMREYTKDMFDAADSNRDGTIDRNELRQVFMSFDGDSNSPFKKTDEEINQIFDRLDTNHDGEISLDEYQVFMTECLVAFLNS